MTKRIYFIFCLFLLLYFFVYGSSPHHNHLMKEFDRSNLTLFFLSFKKEKKMTVWDHAVEINCDRFFNDLAIFLIILSERKKKFFDFDTII